MKTRRPTRRLRRPRHLRRWVAAGALALVAFLYVSPLRTYLEAREALARRSADVAALAREKQALERRLEAQTSMDSLVRDARRLGLVRPGERLFIVKGIPAWRRAHAAETGE